MPGRGGRGPRGRRLSLYMYGRYLCTHFFTTMHRLNGLLYPLSKSTVTLALNELRTRERNHLPQWWWWKEILFIVRRTVSQIFMFLGLVPNWSSGTLQVSSSRIAYSAVRMVPAVSLPAMEFQCCHFTVFTAQLILGSQNYNLMRIYQLILHKT